MALSRYAIWQNDGIVVGMDEKKNIIKEGSVDTARERLYEREEKREAEHLPRYSHEAYGVRKSKEQEDVATDWDIPEDVPQEAPAVMSYKPKRSYRAIALTFGVVFFIISSAIAALYLTFGNQDISGSNIRISVNAPYAVGGGEEANIIISVANNNSTAITEAELIVEYPQGTEIDGERSRELVVKRYPLQTIASGETVNTELRPRLFGEENDEKDIRVSVEYKVDGSAATFYRESDPVRVVISSSPVSIVLDSVTSITSGQEYVLTATLISNSDADLTNLIVQATYPRTFDVKSSEPTAVAGRNTWRIEKLEPGEETKITIVGILSGDRETIQAIDVSVGLASQVDTSKLTSTLSTARMEVLIEAPFLAIELSANRQNADTVAFAIGQEVQMDAKITNTLTQPIYNIALLARLTGTAADLTKVSATKGYIDLGEGIITFDKIEDAALTQLNPGESRTITFGFTPKADVRTPEIIVSLDVAAARSDSATAARDLSAARKMTIRFISAISVLSVIEHVSGIHPPRVGEKTEYRATFSVQGGGNESRDSALTAQVPRGVMVDALPAGVTFTESTRTLTWTIGTIAANEPKTVVVPLSHTPTVLEVGTRPTLVQPQTVVSTDQFTRQQVTLTLPALTTQTANSQSDGQVQQ